MPRGMPEGMPEKELEIKSLFEYYDSKRNILEVGMQPQSVSLRLPCAAIFFRNTGVVCLDEVFAPAHVYSPQNANFQSGQDNRRHSVIVQLV